MLNCRKMAIQYVSIAIIIVLLGYIVILHIQLTKRNIFIQTTVKRLAGIEKSRNMNDMTELMMDIQKLSLYRSIYPDKLLEESTIDFIFKNDKDLKIYLHYTKDESDARSIIINGFKFVDSFYKTALPVSKDKLDLMIKHSSRKYFGQYLIIICIANDIVNHYILELEKNNIKNYSFENVLTETPPFRNENSDLIYQLPPQYIKGYINNMTGEIFKNPGFNPEYNSPGFNRNIGLLRDK